MSGLTSNCTDLERIQSPEDGRLQASERRQTVQKDLAAGVSANEPLHTPWQHRCGRCDLVEFVLMERAQVELGWPAEGKLGGLLQLTAHDWQPAVRLDAEELDDRGQQSGWESQELAGQRRRKLLNQASPLGPHSLKERSDHRGREGVQVFGAKVGQARPPSVLPAHS